MSSVPSSAIILVIGIIAACLLAGLVITAVTQQRQAAQRQETKINESVMQNTQNDYLQYAGGTLTGDTVLSVIVVYKDEPITLVVDNGITTSYYNYTDVNRTAKQDFGAMYKAAKNKAVNNGAAYINPADTYKCTVNYEDNGSVKALVFTKQ